MQPSPTRYAKAGDVHIAWAEMGDGPVDVVFCNGYVSHVEHLFTPSPLRATFERISRFGRIIVLDRRSSGLSDRAVGPPTLEEQMEDVTAVLDAAGSERAALFGFTAGGALAVLLAATFPERCSSLILLTSFARTQWADDYDWALSDEDRRATREALFANWGTGMQALAAFPSRARDPDFVAWFGTLERLSGGPGDARRFFDLIDDVDVRDVLPSVRVPTLVLHPAEPGFFDVRHSEYLAGRIPGARLARFPGPDLIPSEREARDVFAGEIEEHLTGARRGPEPDRALATILFTDIVDSTRRAAEAGDHEWAELLDNHERVVHAALQRWSGRAVKGLGDGFLATFDGPTSAVRCALEVVDESSATGLPIRAGLHIGEVERVGGDVRGIAVHIGARVAALAGADEVLVSQTVKDLVVGSGLEMSDRGEHELKGVPGTWRVHRVDG